MSLSLTQEKLMKVTSQCLEMYKTEKVSILQLTKLIGLLSSTAQAVLPAQLQFRYISTSSILDFQCKTGTSLVGPKPKTLQWKMSCTMC